MTKQELKLRAVLYGIRKRCFDSNCKIYKYYGGKGVTVCDRWLGKDGVANFIKDMQPTFKPDLTIERLDVSKDYMPENCRWATVREQANNRTNNRFITYKGRTMTMAYWAEEVGIKYKTLAQRLNKYHWSFEKAITTPLLKKGV